MKVAVCYDWANQQGGAERVIGSIVKIFPRAELFTSVYNPNKASWAKNFSSVKTSFLNKIPLSNRYHRLLFPLLPIAFEQFDFQSFDLVISITSGPAKAIITQPTTKHLCYCLTPPRYLWQKQFLRYKEIFTFLKKQREKDFIFAQRPDIMMATCDNVAQKIKKYYQRKAEVIYPGVDCNKFTPGKNIGDYFLIVSRLVDYKRIDLAIAVFNQLRQKLKIIGNGPELARLKASSKSNIQFLGRVSDQRLIEQYQNSQALLMPQEEDFGLTAIEAQACGRPIIAYNKGGARESVLVGKTGLLFSRQTKASLINAVRKFNASDYTVEACRKNALRFSEELFIRQFTKKVKQVLN